MAFRRCHLAPDIVVWMFGFDFKKNCKINYPTYSIKFYFFFMYSTLYGYIMIIMYSVVMLQCELLEIFTLYYRNCELPAEQIVEFVAKFKVRCPFSGLFPHQLFDLGSA